MFYISTHPYISRVLHASAGEHHLVQVLVPELRVLQGLLHRPFQPLQERRAELLEGLAAQNFLQLQRRAEVVLRNEGQGDPRTWDLGPRLKAWILWNYVHLNQILYVIRHIISFIYYVTYNRSMSHFVFINYPVPPLHFQQHLRTASNLTHNKVKILTTDHNKDKAKKHNSKATS